MAANIRFPDMISSLPKRPVPAWLENFRSTDSLRIEDLLDNSLYYPSSGRDGDPVKYLGGFIHSFVYADYGFERAEILRSLNDAHHGFRGYSMIYCRDVEYAELAPHGWQPTMPFRGDGDPEQYRQAIRTPFAVWAIFERLSDMDANHGPKRFSLLYISGDGVATFQALFHGNKKSPEVVAIIQPGTGFGLNWTDYCDPARIFGRSVLGNPYGKPEYLLYGGWGSDYTPCCWPEYNERIDYWNVPDGELGLWRGGR